MGSLQQPNRFRPFSQNSQGQIPFQESSISGSDTDVSTTSNENLSNDDKYVIRHPPRQESQIQDNLKCQSNRSSVRGDGSLPSNRSSLDISTSSYNTLIIHSVNGTDSDLWNGGTVVGHGGGASNRHSADASTTTSTIPPGSHYHQTTPSNHGMENKSTMTRRTTPTPSVVTKDLTSASLRNSIDVTNTTPNGMHEITEISDDYLSHSTTVLKHLAKEVRVPASMGTVHDTTNLSRLHSLGAQQQQQPAPPLYTMPLEKWQDKSPMMQSLNPHSNHKVHHRHHHVHTHQNVINNNVKATAVSPTLDRAALSKSQPDLSVVDKCVDEEDVKGFRRGVSAPRPPLKTSDEESRKCGSSEGEVWPSAEMVEILIKENSALKLELNNCYLRVAKTQKLEQEIYKVHKAQEDLVLSNDRRERLERAARSRLQNENRRLQDFNRALKEQVDLLTTQMLTRPSSVDSNNIPEQFKRELTKREMFINQLITQNKELVAAKERQEIELSAQRATLQEQRTHIDILDTALTNAQGNVVRLEEECRKKQVYVERVAQLQKALSSVQSASERREQTERKLRLQLERELQRAKLLHHQLGLNGEQKFPGNGVQKLMVVGGSVGAGGSDEWISERTGTGNSSSSTSNDAASILSNTGTDQCTVELMRRLRDREDEILRLESECTKWEQRFLEESTLRQAAIDVASIPKDAKIAALEKTSQETEKFIFEARNEKMRHMDEVHASQKKMADLESKLKELESKLAERDAMIKVLQKHHTYDKGVSSMILGRSPHHTPHASLATTDIDHVLSSSVTREELVSSVLTNSTGFGSTNSYAGSDTSFHMQTYGKFDNNKFDATKQKLDNQLKEIDSQLDSQLLSKRALCCFPGFTNPGTSQRKTKLSKTVLRSDRSNSRDKRGSCETPAQSTTDTSPSPPTPTISEADSSNGMYLLPNSTSSASGDMLLLEKQGRSSQKQRLQDSAPPPSSLPRPPRTVTVPQRSGLPRPRVTDYNRLQETSPVTTPRNSPQIPRKLGEYGRLSSDSSTSINHVASPTQSRKTVGTSEKPRFKGGRTRVGPAPTSRSNERPDSGATVTSTESQHSSSLPPPAKIRMFGGTHTRRGGSLSRDQKTQDHQQTIASKYRIQF